MMFDVDCIQCHHPTQNGEGWKPTYGPLGDGWQLWGRNMAMAYLVGGAISPSWKMIELKSMGFGWHPIYEMENKPFMFETTKQLLNIVPKHQGPCRNSLFWKIWSFVPNWQDTHGHQTIGQKYDQTRDCWEKHMFKQTLTCCLNIG